MKRKILKLTYYLLIFLIFLTKYLISTPTLDNIWCYGSSLNIFNGLLPYKDFNTITPCFSYFIILPFYKIFGVNSLVFYIFNSIILTLIIYLTDKLFNKKSLLILLPLLSVSFSLSIYNYYILLLLLIIIYLERFNNNKDYLIGFIIGLSILTKQTLGIFFIIPTFIYYKDIKKIIKRLIGLIIPITLFLMYLIHNNILNDFIDKCILGLFNFGESNFILTFETVTIILISLLFLLIIYLKRKKLDKLLILYALIFYLDIIPLFSLQHFTLVIIPIIYIFIDKKEFKYQKNINIIIITILLMVSLLKILDLNKNTYNYPNKVNNFEYNFISKSFEKYIKEYGNLLNKYKNKKYEILSTESYFYKIINNLKINKYDMPLKGNLGYNGRKELIEEIKKNKDTYYILSRVDLNNHNKKFQFEFEIVNYILNNSKKIECVNNFCVYYIK